MKSIHLIVLSGLLPLAITSVSAMALKEVATLTTKDGVELKVENLTAGLSSGMERLADQLRRVNVTLLDWFHAGDSAIKKGNKPIFFFC